MSYSDYECHEYEINGIRYVLELDCDEWHWSAFSTNEHKDKMTDFATCLQSALDNESRKIAEAKQKEEDGHNDATYGTYEQQVARTYNSMTH